jgi:hypothetical protein
MNPDRKQITETCHSERSEESSGMYAGAYRAGFFAALRMTNHGQPSVLIREIRGQ